VQAMNEALREEMRRDSRVFLMGEDVRLGVFGTTKGLVEEFGTDRVRNTPITEAAVVGAALGASVTGMRPVVDIMTANFMHVAMDQFANQAAKLRYMFGAQINLPVVYIASTGIFGSAAAQHSDSLYPLFMNIGGLKIAVPGSPRDAKGLLKAAIRDDDPVLFFEPVALLAGDKGPVPEEEYVIPLGQAEIKRAGKDATVVAIGAMVRQALAAAETLAAEGLQVEVVDPCTLNPMDWTTILESVRKTGRLVVVEEARLTGGAGAEIAAVVGEECFADLKAPIRRVAAPDVPVPFSPPLEEFLLPNAAHVVEAVRSIRGVEASPLAQRVARQAGIDLVQVRGSGPQGRVVKADVETFLASAPASTPAMASQAGTEEIQPTAAAVVEVVLPKFGWTMEEATLVEWLKEAGEQVAEGEPLFVIETDKANQEVEAPASGVLSEVRAGEGESIPVGAVIGLITGDQTGPPAPAPADAAITAQPAVPSRPAQRIPLAGTRRAIAERMTASLREAAQLSLTIEVDLTETAARFAEFSPTAIVVQAVAGALGEHPMLNSTLVGGEIQVWEQRDIGVAVALPDNGLVVPVVREADTKDLARLTSEISALAEKARASQLSAGDLSGGTFTVTNLGMYGIDAFTPILDPPQTAILGVGRWVEKPSVVDGRVAIRTLAVLSLTIDHRVVDGALGAAFLQNVAQWLAQGDFR